jgi:hypothetical protein
MNEWGHGPDHYLGIGDEYASGAREGDERNLRRLKTDHVPKPSAIPTRSAKSAK